MSDRRHAANEETKVCPFCSNTILKPALVCPYCREKLGWHRLFESIPKILLWVFLLFMCCGLAMCGGFLEYLGGG